MADVGDPTRSSRDGPWHVGQGGPEEGSAGSALRGVPRQRVMSEGKDGGERRGSVGGSERGVGVEKKGSSWRGEGSGVDGGAEAGKRSGVSADHRWSMIYGLAFHSSNK